MPKPQVATIRSTILGGLLVPPFAAGLAVIATSMSREYAITPTEMFLLSLGALVFGAIAGAVAGASEEPDTPTLGDEAPSAPRLPVVSTIAHTAQPQYDAA